MGTLDNCRLLLLAVIASLAASPTHAADRVRLLRSCEPMLVADASSLSPTVRSLLERIDRSDLIVFVRCVSYLAPSLAGRLILLGAAEKHRFVLIEIRIPAQWHTQAAVLAHELQHAVEVADAPAVRSQAAMAEHYARAGIALSGRAGVFDTEAARRTGLQVLRELPPVPTPGSTRMRESSGDVTSQR